ncbi:hypothetical protein [Comamonas thiooxydans]|uniref:hypothetical protein n=1 Tax=Comamonas thiooxydans TaxID=363952 RepID=UPI000B41B8BF|nr:hypothetical protein [Comamonas thiooxydans]
MTNFTKYKSELILFILFVVIGVFTISAEMNRKAQRKLHRDNTSVAEISIEARLKKYPERFVQDNQESWALANTDEWAILNGFAAAQGCPPLLEVMYANPQIGMLSPPVAMLLANNPEPQQIKLAVPTFKARPRGVEGCVGLAYDEKSGHLVNGPLKVAFLLK